ncbi:MAG: replication/maintenance protein RepL [Clostridia bacterium]|nr:replication/maintenance protein RepL [Clostridia bacterium]MBQ9513807.1 replication/maintenance protein RepL [Clostridia bacterium]
MKRRQKSDRYFFKSMIEVIINDLSVFDEKLNKIHRAMTLLSFYTQYPDENNVVRFTKTELEQLLNRPRRTINNWIKVLIDNGAIKYKTNGTTYLNPFYYYKGTSEGYEKAKKLWEATKSDLVS